MAHRRGRAYACSSLSLLLIILAACGGAPPVVATSPQLLVNATGLYPRLIRLEHSGAANGRILASIVSFSGNNGMGLIYASADGGASFTRTGVIADPEAAGGQGLCCATLFELPQPVGSLAAGTLLWAASVGQDAANRRMRLRIWASQDQGQSWAYLSACAEARNGGGLWEPEFSIAADGALVCHYSDETGTLHSQKLVETRSYDGRTWQDATDTVASAAPVDRPGMPIVRTLPEKGYIMSYELCPASGAHRCAAHYRTSADGWDWGAADAPGTRVEAADGSYFAHAPTLAWTQHGGAQGSLYMVGQLLETRGGSPAAGSGATLLKNRSGGDGTWEPLAAPVPVPEAYDNYCPNYSSALLPSEDGRSILELATRYDGTTCKAYFASGPG